jgi:hypothetical protein
VTGTYDVLPRKEVDCMGQLVPTCYICGQIPEQGFNSGIFLFKKFLCEPCQDKILEVKITDQDYQMVLEKIKQLWNDHPREKNNLMKQKG